MSLIASAARHGDATLRDSARTSQALSDMPSRAAAASELALQALVEPERDPRGEPVLLGRNCGRLGRLGADVDELRVQARRVAPRRALRGAGR